MIDGERFVRLEILRRQREHHRAEQDRAINVLRAAIDREKRAIDEIRAILSREGASAADYREWLG